MNRQQKSIINFYDKNNVTKVNMEEHMKKTHHIIMELERNIGVLKNKESLSQQEVDLLKKSITEKERLIAECKKYNAFKNKKYTPEEKESEKFNLTYVFLANVIDEICKVRDIQCQHKFDIMKQDDFKSLGEPILKDDSVIVHIMMNKNAEYESYLKRYKEKQLKYSDKVDFINNHVNDHRKFIENELNSKGKLALVWIDSNDLINNITKVDNWYYFCYNIKIDPKNDIITELVITNLMDQLLISKNKGINLIQYAFKIENDISRTTIYIKFTKTT